jgi:fibro-slime domain-containing protein
MSSLVRLSLVRAVIAGASLVAIACGGTPTVTVKPDIPISSGGMGASAGTGGSGATGNEPGITFGGMGGENEGDTGGAPPDPCAGPNPPDTCMFQPSGPACGDGEINQDTEECDDGNSLPGDGCSGICQVEPYYKCPTPGMPCELTIACGDGVVDPGEFCDDGNTEDGDGCSADCEMQDPNYVCPDPGKPCQLLYDCGDGRVNGTEQCDDGNKKSGDGCSSKCKKEDGYVCTRPGMPCVLDQYCGDGIVQASLGEDCDDGNKDSGDGCSSICKVDPYFECDNSMPSKCTSTIVCGDGVRDPGEVCDDGNTMDGDGCSADCKTQDASYICPTPGQLCTRLYQCGDGRLNGSELTSMDSSGNPNGCDDGNTMDGDGCSSTCTVETGYICRHPGQLCVLNQYCGDGKVEPGEQCDDGNNDYTDGCYGDCTIAPYFSCPPSGGACTSTIVCGDGRRDPGEACDDHNTANGDGCSSLCTVEANWSCTGAAGATSTCKKLVACGDKRVNGGETCDDGNTVSNDGCSSTCQIEAGYTCATPGAPCTPTVVCGDGKRASSEQCDDGGTIGGDGCSAQCKIENDWSCTGAVGAKSTCTYTVVCGDGKLGGAETCDDGNKTSGDGCSSTCTVESGYKCARAGVACNPICGDGVIKSPEQCDIGTSTVPTDVAACTKCRLNAGYTCGANGTGPCSKTVCGNGPAITDPINSAAYITKAKAAAEPGEGCDDGNTVAGDGCGPTCQLEPAVTVGPSPVVAVTCGDGLITGTETCDDGNKTKGDGCDDTCQVETGWSCSGSVSYPDSIAFRVTYRDFRQRTEAGGHPHMKANGAGDTTTQAGSPGQGSDPGIVGTVCNTTNGTTCGRLDSEGKPTYVGTGTHTSIDTTGDGLTASYHQDAFKLWYRDTNANNVNDPNSQANGGTPTPIQMNPNPAPVPAGGDFITLKKLTGTGSATTKSAYQFDSTVAGNPNTFYPLGCTDCTPVVAARGFGYTPGATPQRNWQFTTELRYFFQYQGGETLTFFGDDDVWVFINGRLAVDIGGIHGQTYGRVILGDDGAGTAANDSTCTVNEGTSLPACTLDANESAATHTTDNRFALTKGGVYEIVVFQAERHPTGSDYQLTLDGFLAPRSTCTPICGQNPASQGSGTTITPPEECDDGNNNTATPTYGKCTAGTCTLGPYCGDGTVNGTEACDNGSNNAQYGQSGCAPGCVLPAKCGDGKIDTPFEQCDNGSANSSTGYGGCKTDCTVGPRCGDGIVNGTETCDDGVNDGSYGGCTPTCTSAPKCGDGVVDTAFGEACDGGAGCDANCQLKCGNGVLDAGEQCDDGVLAGGYGRCAAGCVVAEFCGDGVRSGPEECDNGAANSNTAYGGCTTSCKLGPHCGDGIKNGTEACDDGKNDGYYNGCNPDCTPAPSCGDGAVQPEWGEECDDAATPTTCSHCHLLGSCGDGITQNPPEECDLGTLNNTGEYGGCTPQCLEGPRCGDGVVQAPQEQCDDGDSGNDGSYNGCTDRCQLGPYCGDGIVTKPEEVCDDGINDNFYASCTPDCKGFGPRCGDGIVQTEWGEECDAKNDPNCVNCRLGAQCGDGVVQSGEECDDGVNDGGYGECGPKCQYGPRCGDGVVQSDHEQCDDGVNTGGYGKCAPGCVYGPYCGDGKLQKQYEECDDGNNRSGDGCSSACKKETQVPR